VIRWKISKMPQISIQNMFILVENRHQIKVFYQVELKKNWF